MGVLGFLLPAVLRVEEDGQDKESDSTGLTPAAAG
jgi:hypothetical protein